MTPKDYAHWLSITIADTRSKYFCISEKQRSYKPTPAVWSKKEILGHLIDSARYNLQRFSEITTQSGTYNVIPYDQNRQVEINNYQHEDDYEILTLWQLINKRIINILENLDESQSNKIIVANNQPHTFEWLIEDYMTHLKHHLDQILDNVGSDIVPCKVNSTEAIEKWKNHFKSTQIEFLSLIDFADLQVEYYKPHLVDRQSPHLKDEVYIIVSGSGSFFIEGETIPFVTGDILYTKAGDDHRFLDFTDDFATWVIFYGVKNSTLR